MEFESDDICNVNDENILYSHLTDISETSVRSFIGLEKLLVFHTCLSVSVSIAVLKLSDLLEIRLNAYVLSENSYILLAYIS